jgi:hypothetical protein
VRLLLGLLAGWLHAFSLDRHDDGHYCSCSDYHR